MKKTLLCFLAVGILVWLAAPVQALNLVGNGGFETGAITFGSYTAGTTLTGQWYGQAQWIIEDTGTNKFAKHQTDAARFYQGIEPVAAGTTLTLSFDYEYDEQSFTGGSVNQGEVVLLGLMAGDTIGVFPPMNWPGVEIYHDTLDFVNGWSPYDPVNIDILASYDYLALVFVANAYLSGTVPVPGLRAIDNVALETAAVPEPATLLLLGTGLAGLVTFRRRFRN